MADAGPIVLAGGGHSHALVLQAWIRDGAPAGATLVSDTLHAPYSGMLPGEVAGFYTPEQAHIDLRALCRRAGVRFVQGEAAGIDRDGRRLLLQGGDSLPYGWLSLNLGATPRMPDTREGAHAVPVKPISGFRGQWTSLLARVLAADAPMTVAVVGAGVAGVELTLALHARLRTELRAAGHDPSRVHWLLLGGDAQLVPGLPEGARRRLALLLEQRGIPCHLGERVVAVEAAGVRTAAGRLFACDESLWVTGAGAAAWLAQTGLALDEAGFLRVDACLRSVNDPRVFAAGDVASPEGLHVPKSGVVAVRQGPVLAQNLRRAVHGQPLLAWRPQRHWLVIVGTADGRAIATRGRWHVEGAWAWRWKDAIDRRFMRRFEAAAA